MKWSKKAWDASLVIYNEILKSPFNVGLMEGSLPKEVFKNYLKQDTIYIANYSEEMGIIADMIEDIEYKNLFTQFSIDGMEAEKELHKHLAEKLGIKLSSEKNNATEVTLAYINHTRQYVDAGNLEFSLAAILPCIWVYNEIGIYLAANCKKENNPYLDWINTYSSPLMLDGINSTIAFCDKLASNSDEKTSSEMIKIFVEGVEHELVFFNDSFR